MATSLACPDFFGSHSLVLFVFQFCFYHNICFRITAVGVCNRRQVCVDETGFEPVRLRLQRSALPLELFVRFVWIRFANWFLFPLPTYRQAGYWIHLLLNNFILPESCRRFELLSFGLQPNAYAMSASRTFAESSGFEPLHRINDDSLAGHYITALSTLQNIFCGERGNWTPNLLGQLFSRQLPLPSGLSPSWEW